MIRLGLTGSIGSGKSTIAKMMRAKGVPAFDCDDYARKLGRQPAFKAAEAGKFPEAVVDGVVSRGKVRDLAFADDAARLPDLNAIYHPPILAAMESFFVEEERKGAKLAVADMPLLFEAQWENYFHFIMSAYVPLEIQRRRVLSRPGMTLERFEANIRAVLSNDERVQLSDFAIRTERGKAKTRDYVEGILAALDRGTVRSPWIRRRPLDAAL